MSENWEGSEERREYVKSMIHWMCEADRKFALTTIYGYSEQEALELMQEMGNDE